MSFRLVIRRDAEADLNDAYAWYEEQRIGLGEVFLDTVEAALTDIAANPKLHPVVHQEVRRALIRRFPFGIHYLVEDDAVVVLAVFHASRDPKHWQGRT